MHAIFALLFILAPGDEDLTAKEASKELKAATKVHAKNHAAEVKRWSKAFDKGDPGFFVDDPFDDIEGLKSIESKLGSGEYTPAEAVHEAFTLLDLVLCNLDAASRLALGLIEPNASSILEDLAAGEDVPKDFINGENGTLDKTLDKMKKLVDKSVPKVGKRLDKMDSKLKKADVRMSAWVGPLHFPGVVPAADAPTTEPMQPLVIDAFLGAGGVGPETLGTGWLYLGGFADVANGATLDVTIEQPGGSSQTIEDVEIDAEGLRWLVRFPGDMPAEDNLPSGNYFVTVVQGTHTVSGVASVP